eukprot:2574326-Rhodomonas_salina.2
MGGRGERERRNKKRGRKGNEFLKFHPNVLVRFAVVAQRSRREASRGILSCCCESEYLLSDAKGRDSPDEVQRYLAVQCVAQSAMLNQLQQMEGMILVALHKHKSPHSPSLKTRQGSDTGFIHMIRDWGDAQFSRVFQITRPMFLYLCESLSSYIKDNDSPLQFYQLSNY